MPVSRKTQEEQQQQTTPVVSSELVPYWMSECGRVTIYVGDNVHIMQGMEPEQFHAIVTDPPYGLEFMGQDWDAPWKNDGKIEVCDEGTDVSHPFRDGSRRVCYGNKKVHARQHRAAEMDDTVKAKYLRHNVEYVRDSQLYQQWFFDRAALMLAVAKPGAHFLSFGGTRMWHRTSCAIEDAGWDIRDTVMWIYGNGFPKSLDVSKAIDRMHGCRNYDPSNKRDRTDAGWPASVGLPMGREVVGTIADRRGDGTVYGLGHTGALTSNMPVTDDAKQWNGWGTGLKPAVEPIILARKPLAGSVAKCVLENGCGGLNIDGCRVGTEERWNDSAGNKDLDNRTTVTPISKQGETGGRPAVGRWPANLILTHSSECRLVGTRPTNDKAVQTISTGEVVSANKAMSEHNYGRIVVGFSPRPDEDIWECVEDCPVRMLDEQSGTSKSSSAIIDLPVTPGDCHGFTHGSKGGQSRRGHDDFGGASRFFYTAKANTSDRQHGYAKGDVVHPTVKPLDLMCYLVRLICPKGGTVLDPFMGSGSTGCACIEEGMYFVGIEQSKEYADIAVDRMKELLGVHPIVKRIQGTNKRTVISAPVPPKALRGT